MKKIILATLFVGVLLASVFTVTHNINAAAAKKPMKGQIVSLADIVNGKKGADNLQLTKERVEELEKFNNPLVFFYNKKVYFIQNEDGSLSTNRIAKFAHYKLVGIYGKTKTVNGVNIIIMTDIASMD